MAMDDTAALWDTSTQRQLAVLQHDDGVQQAAFSPDGNNASLPLPSMKGFASGMSAVERCCSSSLAQRSSAGHLFAFSSDGRLIATANGHRVVYVWNAIDELCSRTLTHLHLLAINCICFSPNGRLLLTCGDDKSPRSWIQKPERACIASRGPVCFAAFSPVVAM